MPLRLAELPKPKARSGEIVIKVKACGVCSTDLQVVDDLRHGRFQGTAVLMP